MTGFYRLSHRESRNTPYASTILSSNDVNLSNCPVCGRTRFNHSNRELSLLIEGKGKLPDYLLCGHYPLIIISDKAHRALDDAGVTGYESFPVRLVSKDLGEIEQAHYHNVIITGKAELDYSQMGVEITSVCKECGAVEYNKNSWELGPAIIKENTYDGTDLFVLKHFRAAPLCTMKVLETVYKNKLTNFEFKDLETMFMLMPPSNPIDLKELFG